MYVKLTSNSKLVISILFCEFIGFASALFSNIQGSSWFDTLRKPSWNPPAYLFGPVWILLYLLMGIAFWLIWKSENQPSIKINSIGIFIIQLICNFLWSIFFFRLHQPSLAFINIVVLLITIALTMYYFSKISKKATWLFVPYLLWVCFATVLNYSIWKLN